jgi:hypothetical protein
MNEFPGGAQGDGAAIRIETGDLPVAMAGVGYDTWLQPCGAQYTWKITGDSPLAPGLTMTDAGVISGKPKNFGVFPFTVTLSRTGAQATVQKDLRLIVSHTLEVTTDVTRQPNRPAPDGDFIADLHAAGGTPPYVWSPEPGTDWPDELRLAHDGRVSWANGSASLGSRKFTVRCTDLNGSGYHATGTFFINARLPRRWWRRAARTQVAGLSTVTMIRPSLRTSLLRRSNYLLALGLGLPAIGAVMILMYTLTAPGSKLGHLGIALLVAFTTFLVGAFGGFLLGVPRVVSSGQAQHTAGLQYAPSTNLAEVSDWLTKLLLGAGLVQLTHLGAPIGSLIDSVARSLNPASSPGSFASAQVMAGAILFGYIAVGLLDGYLMTTTWYQSWITRHVA